MPAFKYWQKTLTSELDQTELKLQFWFPEAGDPEWILLIYPGLGEHSGRYEHLIKHLGDTSLYDRLGIVGLDPRGHGLSGGKRGFANGYKDFLTDLDQVAEELARSYSESKSLLFAHSLGGAIATAYTLQNPKCFRGLILSAPAFQPLPQGLKGRIEAQLARIFAGFAGRLCVNAGIHSQLLTADPQEQKRQEEDELNHSWVGVKLGAAMLKTKKWLWPKLPSFSLPVFIVHGDQDQLVDLDASREFLSRIKSTDKELFLAKNGRHELVNEEVTIRKQVLEAISTKLIVWSSKK